MVHIIVGTWCTLATNLGAKQERGKAGAGADGGLCRGVRKDGSGWLVALQSSVDDVMERGANVVGMAHVHEVGVQGVLDMPH